MKRGLAARLEGISSWMELGLKAGKDLGYS